MKLTEEWLNNAAGWKVMKQARMLHQGRAVIEATFDGRTLRGVVTSRGKPLAAGLRIDSPTDVENLCNCPASRRTGEICEHSAAVGLGVTRGIATPKTAPGDAAKREEPAASKAVEPRRLRLRFDPRLGEMWAKGRIPARLEEGEEPMAGLTSWAEKAGLAKLPAQLVLNPAQASELLASVQGEESTWIGDEPLTVTETPAARIPIRLEEKGDDFRFVREGDFAEGQRFLTGEGKIWAWYAARRVLQPFREAPPGGAEVLGRLVQEGSADVSAIQLLLHLDGWQDCLGLPDDAGEGVTLQAARPRFRAHFEGSMNALSGQVTVIYDQTKFRLGTEPKPNPFPARPSPRVFVTRNAGAEKAAIARMTEDWGFTGPDADGQFQLRGEDAIGRFYLRGIPSLSREWEIDLGQRFQHVTRQIEVVRPAYEQTGSGEDWLSFTVRYAGGGGVELSREEVQQLLNKGQRKVRLAGGRTALLDVEACEEVAEVLYDTQPLQEGGDFRADRRQAAYLRRALGGEPERSEEVDLSGMEAVGATLRPYQEEGVRWLLEALNRQEAALLADEMGLGKTLQSLAVAECLLRARGGPCLVVCPTSLLTTWRREVARFLPHRRLHELHGPNRWKDETGIRGADFLTTSYGLMVRDLERLREHEFPLVILDEASAIKNPDTQNAKAACRLNAGNRLALTGTPVENSIRELWSIFQFLSPGYLGERKEFQERYEKPVQGGGAPRPVLERLRHRTGPFMLRRTKELVAPDLPGKLEQVRFCELSGPQLQLYETILRESRKKVDDAMADRSEGQARMTMLTALLRLRQVCCDPRLLELETAKKIGSAKTGLFLELLEEAIAGGHRILVFSQFTRMLKLLGSELDDRGWSFCYLDGATRDRKEPVQRFQADGGPPLFLISLKAGGYGLTLTAADTVVHFDPWWNPAVEAQATDRAHRIGQTRAVTSYKLIAAGTVEEKIVALQARKRAVIDAAFDEDQPLMQGLTTEEIREVLG